ncbi:hypothetical protein QFZ30_000263 [Arthrobacter pascens]|uniref:nuclear transport factor 2 family protein n=1 Tax=Arthrobacter pascens TaxID=1677 RepID=UPI002790A37B|nr:nuclear transport factor 2 family protein [Arthrobacter pascens]MDQ0676881.1 hypothetical protein [Arthrobacter pascens]
MSNDNIILRGAASDALSGWTDLWNGELAKAEAICTPDVRIHFGGRTIGEAGDQVSTPSDLAGLIATFRATRPGLLYRVVEAYATADWGYSVWDATMGELHVGGIDTFHFTDGRIAHVYSVTAERPMSTSRRPPGGPG